MSMKLYYWGMPGKAEQIRLTLHVGGVEFEDIHVTGESYAALKEKIGDSKYLINLPLLEVDGQYFSESQAILRFAAGRAGLVPSCEFKAFKAHEVAACADDVFGNIGFTFGISDVTERIAARRALLDKSTGRLYKYLTRINNFLGKLESDFVAGEFSYGDCALYAALKAIGSGLLDGYSAADLEEFTHIVAYLKRVGTHPKVASRYAAFASGPFKLYAA